MATRANKCDNALVRDVEHATHPKNMPRIRSICEHGETPALHRCNELNFRDMVDAQRFPKQHQ